jgi:hypothetical protein
MLESQPSAYRSPEPYTQDSIDETRMDSLERVIRSILLICFLSVLGLELWLLVSALGSG